MLEFQGKIYITDKEASKRYGYSTAWFQKQRWRKAGPPYIRLIGKIYYVLDDIDKWFSNRLRYAD
jgi:hypothetical protein